VLPNPIPTAQISVLVFHDNASINGAPDLPNEAGLPGFKILLFDQVGQSAQDAWFNPLGTTYQRNPDGSFVLDVNGVPVVDVPGNGVFSDANGNATIKYLYPGKYGVRAVPTDNLAWIQTSTIEGTPGQDAWVIANEPSQLVEAGPLVFHVFLGFVHPSNDQHTGLPLDYGPKFFTPGGATIKGRVLSTHSYRPPKEPGLVPGRPVEQGWVGLNDTLNGNVAVFVGPCNDNAEFTITGVPPGTYLMTLWDFPLDYIIDYRSVTVTDNNQVIEMGDIPIFRWFGWYAGYVFDDQNRNGVRDRNPATGEYLEPAVPGQTINLRMRDGSLYKTTVTDVDGYYEFSEVFPFYKWIVAEKSSTDPGRRTGATIWVDNGGPLPVNQTPPVPINFADPSTWHNDVLTPQPQPENGGKGYRTDLGNDYTKAALLYMEYTNWMDWGRTTFGPGENGGISGWVFYQAMHTEIDPATIAPTWWATGIPRVTVNLYEDKDGDGVPDGPPIRTTQSQGWDDNFPTKCVDNDGQAKPFSPYIDCAEFLRTWGQIRPGVYDGIYSFKNLPNGKYIVEVIPPLGYAMVKEEDQNIYFPGDVPTPSLLAPVTPGTQAPVARAPVVNPNPSTTWPCVGQLHHIPEFASWFPIAPGTIVSVNFPYDNTIYDHFVPNVMTPLCDRKQVTLTDGLNAGATFAMFTEVPRAARFIGLVTNDLVAEFNPNSPRKGDVIGPSWMPVTVRDWQGNELNRVYSDEWGQYGSMVPSTWTFAVPNPSGVQPNIWTVVLNDPGPIPLIDNVTGLPVIDPTTGKPKMITDPFFNPAYSLRLFNSNWEAFPGKTTLIDTPILPIAAFTQAHGLLDCELSDGTPVIAQVNGPAGGPYVPRAGTLIRISALTGVSFGTSPRDFGFGSTAGSVTIDGMNLDPVDWTNEIIVARVPVGAHTGQLMVTRGDNGRSSVMGITLHIGGSATRVGGGQTIQSVVDAANPGDLILVPPGIYKENLILWKPLQLQGYGPWATAIDAGFFGPDQQTAWAAKVAALVTSGTVRVVPGERADFFLAQGAGILVLSDNVLFRTNPSRIDGLLVTGGNGGSGINVNGYVQNLVVSNNKLQSNQGFFGGAIRLGTPSIVLTDAEGNTVAGASTFNSNENTNISIHHNHVDQNGASIDGGGIGIYNGAHGYGITENYICGNYSIDRAGGIQHMGYSDNGVIQNNTILMNESFSEGGGILISGEFVPAGAPAGSLTEGTGNVTVDRNLIQGNHAGTDGGGIRTILVNGQDVQANPTDNTKWYRIDILNNMIVNNVGSYLAGGIAISDSANINIIHNTIAHNDTTATSSNSFGGPCNVDIQLCVPGSNTSVSQAAGIVSQVHTPLLQGPSGQTFSNPVLYNNVIWHNRSFHWETAINNGFGGIVPSPDNAVIWNLSVFAGLPGQKLQPRYSILDNNTAVIDNTVAVDNTNVLLDPRFRSPYFNVFEATAVGASLGNFVQVNYSPLHPAGDYRLTATSPAIDRAFANFGSILPGWIDAPLLNLDFDGRIRPFDVTTVTNNPSPADIGAAEYRP
jgi:hypothetical protein